jgi:hypothetical protein
MHIRDQEIDFVKNSAMSIEDPAIDQFSLYIDFNANYGLFADEAKQNSALAYLKRTGEDECYNNLKIAINFFKQLLLHNSYRLVSIEGIEALFETRTQRGVQTPLTLSFRETLEHKLRFALISIMKATYDMQRQIFILPENLLRFSCVIYFSDMRALASNSNTDYAKKFGGDVNNLKAPQFDQYGLNRDKRVARALNKIDNALTGKRTSETESPEQRLVHIENMQHIAISMPVCELMIPNIQLTANHLDMQNMTQSVNIIVKRFNISALVLDTGKVSEKPETLSNRDIALGYLEKRKQQLKNQLEIALLTKVEELKIKATDALLLAYDNITNSRPIWQRLSSYLKTAEFWQGTSSRPFQEQYSQYKASLDTAREQRIQEAFKQYPDKLS